MAAPSEHIVLFDGVCNLCERSVTFIIERDAAARFRFASLQSEIGTRLAAEHGINGVQTVVLIEEGRAWVRSDAALRIARGLDGAWPVVWHLRFVPRPVRDAVYDWIAANRYRWFGKKDACMVPTSTTQARFLTDVSPSPSPSPSP